MTAVEIERQNGQREMLVVLVHGAADRAANPDFAADEHTLLRVLHAEGLPVPAPRYVDPTGDIFGIPCVVVELLEGTTSFAPLSAVAAAEALAVELARTHAVGYARSSPRPWTRCRVADVPAAPTDGLALGSACRAHAFARRAARRSAISASTSSGEATVSATSARRHAR